MVWLFGIVVVIVVVVIAASIIGREAGRLAVAPPRPVYDPDEAVEYVADRLPDEVTAVLSFADVRRLLGWHLDWFRAQGVAAGPEQRLVGDDRPASAQPTDDVIVVDDDVAAEVLAERARIAGTGDTDEQIEVVLAAHMDYLVHIGAVGPVDDD